MKGHFKYLLVILFIAAFLRLYRIEALTVFLADQGSAGVIIFEAWKSKTLPLAGPAVSTGQRPGPFFYYLIAPAFILSNFNPIVPAMMMGLIGAAGVYLLYLLARDLFNQKTALILSGFWALSAHLVAQDRNLWNPTAIPFLVIWLLYALYQVVSRDRFQFIILTGLLNAALIQLHYTNIYTLLCTVGLLIYKYFTSRSKLKLTSWLTASLTSFLFIMLPFLIYEVKNQFIDLRELILSVLYSANFNLEKNNLNPLAFVRDLVRYIIPVTNLYILNLIIFCITIINIFQKNKWLYAYLGWFVLGIIGVSLYPGSVHSHYLYFLMPLVFLLSGSVIFKLEQKIPKQLALIAICLIVLANLVKTDIFSTGTYDIAQSKIVASEIIKTADQSPFAFTLFSSRSFSDYHYRYFFRINNVKISTVSNSDYNLLFIVCEQGVCPSGQDLNIKSDFQTMCYDHHCEGDYPKIDLRRFSFKNELKLYNATLYRFEKLKI